MSRLRKLTTWTQYLPTSAPFWQMEIIHIIYISRYLKKPVQFHKMRWFWISRKDENMLEALKWNLNLELKLGCTQTSEKLVLRCQFTMSFLLSGNLFQNCQLFFLIKGSKCILTCKYQSKEISMCNIPKIFSFYLLWSETNPKLKHKISHNRSKRPYFLFSEIWYRSHSILEEVNNLLPFVIKT